MIPIQNVKNRRAAIAELRHADSIYRDIKAREQDRKDYEKRWFWELLQNAKDSVSSTGKVSVKLIISEDKITFAHSGNPFELDDILSLIIQGSSKNDKEEKTGRFGTGFMTTYLLSKAVTISGKLVNNEGCFQFLIDRSADNNGEFYDKQVQSNDDFENSIREDTYLADDIFQTQFSYALDPRNNEVAQNGLKCLDELIPVTQLFNIKGEISP